MLPATRGFIRALSVGETADMAGLATCSTAGESSRSAKIRTSSRAMPDLPKEALPSSKLFLERMFARKNAPAHRPVSRRQIASQAVLH